MFQRVQILSGVFVFSLLALTAIETNSRAEDKPATPPLKGDIAPSSDSSQPFTAQPSGLPENERQAFTGTPLVGPEKTWSLPELIDEALKRNPSTRQAWETARVSEADLAVARSYYYPTATVSASGGPSHNTSPLYPGTTTVDQWTGGPQLQIQYLLLDFGARNAAVEAARFTLLANNFNYNQTLQTIVLNVMTSYYNVDNARANVENAEAAVALAQSTFDSTQIKSKAGLTAVTDVYQAKQTLAQDQFNLENARGALSQAHVQLLTSVGMPGNTHIDVSPPVDRPSTAVLEQEIDKLVDTALRQRPDLANRYAVWRSQLAAANQAEANRWPQLTVGANLQRTYYDAHSKIVEGAPTTDSNGQYDGAAAMLTFSWDVFDGGNKLNAARSAKRQADAARAALQQAELGAISDVVLNFIAFKTAAKSVDAAEVLVESSQQSYDSTNISYKSGLKSILDLLTAENNLASAKATLAQSRTNLYTAAASLANATGDILPHPLTASNNTPPSPTISTTPQSGPTPTAPVANP